jgi:hypothetical protein
MAVHRHWKSWDLEQEMSWPEAVVDWYDNLYLPLVNKIREEDILAFFPGRTEGDLVVWVLRHWEKLERDYGGEDIPPDEVVEDFAGRTRSNPLRRLLAWFERTVLGKWVDEDT